MVIKHGNGTSRTNGSFIRKFTDQWSIFHCHGWLPEGIECLIMWFHGYVFHLQISYRIQPSGCDSQFALVTKSPCLIGKGHVHLLQIWDSPSLS